MALPSSGALSFSSIAGEMGISAANALSYLASYAGNSTGYIPPGLTSKPNGMGEFFGFNFQSITYSAVDYKVGDPCGYGATYYYGSNGKLYYSPGGSPVDGEFLFSYSYFDWEMYQYVYDMYFMSSGSFNYYGTNSSGCAPW
jgi:hypothetical protein